MALVLDYPLRSKPGEPVWELATLYPNQGQWSVTEYLHLNTNRLVEFNHGKLEFPAMPTRAHQQVVAILFQLLAAWTSTRNGHVLFALVKVRTAPDKFREPDLVVFLNKNDERAGNNFFDGADLVMEVVSEDAESIERDYVKKRAEYEAAGIPEYWIVDPQARRITVLALRDGKYVEHDVATESAIARSALLEGFAVQVASAFAVA